MLSLYCTPCAALYLRCQLDNAIELKSPCIIVSTFAACCPSKLELLLVRTFTPVLSTIPSISPDDASLHGFDRLTRHDTNTSPRFFHTGSGPNPYYSHCVANSPDPLIHQNSLIDHPPPTIVDTMPMVLLRQSRNAYFPFPGATRNDRYCQCIL